MHIERIEKAIYSGETLRVRYFGGSTPGSERQIKPISADSDSVRARCLQTGETKLFKLAKLEEVLDGLPSELSKTFIPPAPAHETVASFAESVIAEVEALGWLPQIEGDLFSLHRRFKNGKPMKGSDVSISFEATTYDLVFDGENTVEMNHRPRERPWIVVASKQTTKTFANATKAQASFLEFAKLLAAGLPK